MRLVFGTAAGGCPLPSLMREMGLLGAGSGTTVGRKGDSASASAQFPDMFCRKLTFGGHWAVGLAGLVWWLLVSN